jgi:hypothetical protein
MRRILMSDEMKGQIEMLAGAQLILRLKIGAFLFESCTSSRKCSIGIAEWLFLHRPSYQVRHFKLYIQ